MGVLREFVLLGFTERGDLALGTFLERGGEFLLDLEEAGRSESSASSWAEIARELRIELRVGADRERGSGVSVAFDNDDRAPERREDSLACNLLAAV